ncbi:hypothetical protein B0A53_05098 [Rhodotorula sp. CCFEE 5036]|nr:hypothetical protein B0A53_05098 [Rhodotorula sp. CCFEE 5036]
MVDSTAQKCAYLARGAEEYGQINLNGSDMDKEVAKAEQRAYNTLSYLLHWDEHGMIPYGHEPKKRWHYDYGTTSTPERGSDHSHDPSYHARRLIKMMPDSHVQPQDALHLGHSPSVSHLSLRQQRIYGRRC